jgi:hypothetical protein
LPNIYYSGQWNEALKRFDSDILFILNSDVKIKDYKRMMKRLIYFYEKYGDRAGLYAPNHFWTPWTYNPAKLKSIGNGMKIVPATDSTLWSVRREIALQVGPMDLEINKLGWGIEIIAAWYANKRNKLVVRDYAVKCHHPQSTSYDRETADREWRDMIDKMGLGDEFWQYYNSRYDFDFGWQDEDPPMDEVKKLML